MARCPSKCAWRLPEGSDSLKRIEYTTVQSVHGEFIADFSDMKWTVPAEIIGDNDDGKGGGENMLMKLDVSENAFVTLQIVQKAKKDKKGEKIGDERWLVMWTNFREPVDGKSKQQTLQLKGYLNEEHAVSFMREQMTLFSRGKVTKEGMEDCKKKWLQTHGNPTAKAKAKAKAKPKVAAKAKQKQKSTTEKVRVCASVRAFPHLRGHAWHRVGSHSRLRQQCWTGSRW